MPVSPHETTGKLNDSARLTAYDKKLDKSILISGPSLQHNLRVVTFWRVLCAVVAGSVTGLLGVYGWHGFLIYLAMHLVMTVPLLFKTRFTPTKYLASWSQVLVDHLLSQQTILTFILFWIITYNVTHVF